ncbi:type II secretion system protein GspL [Desulfolithobacter sp.]
MAKRVLGLDVHDEMVHAAVMEQRAGKIRVLQAAAAPLQGEDLAGALARLGLEKARSRCAVVSAVSPASCSLRNLFLPFQERARIAQVLPLELEEHLLLPPESQVIDFLQTSQSESGSEVLVAALEKQLLRTHLEALQSQGLDPQTVTLHGFALAHQLCQSGREENFLLLDLGLYSLTLVLCCGGKVVFLRHIPSGNKLFSGTAMAIEGAEIVVEDEQEVRTCVEQMCTGVERSLAWYGAENEATCTPGRILLSGRLATLDCVVEAVASCFAQPVQRCDLAALMGAELNRNLVESWRPGCHDHVLALFAGAGKKYPLNFRRQEFAPRRQLLGSRPQKIAAGLVAVALAGVGGFMYLSEYQKLQATYERLDREMKTIYHQTFPEDTRIVDPYLQMQAKLREVQSPATVPAFSAEKRVLRILADISGRIPKSITFHVSRMVIDQETVRIKGVTNAFNNVDAIKNRLGSSPLYDKVEILAATVDKDSGMVRFDIRLTLRPTFPPVPPVAVHLELTENIPGRAAR